jgi:hypothetical protein
MQYRQGDVYLKSVQSVPQSTPVAAKNGRLILAEGEATGHAHAISELDGTLSITADGKLYLHTEAGCDLVHDEHSAIAIAPGNYEVTIQREYSPEAIRNVRD